MRIVVVHPHSDSARQLQEVLACDLSDAEIGVWSDSYPYQADYAVGWLPSAEFLSQQTQLRAFFSLWAGVEDLLSHPCWPAGLPLVRLEDAGMGEQMADYCICEVLRWLRHSDAYDAQKLSRTWRKLPVTERTDWPIGLFGLGVLGHKVASAFMALGFPVNAYARTVHQDAKIVCFAQSGGAGDFAAFMRATRVLIILAPLTAQTQDRFDRAALSQLPASSYVINVARGGLLVDEALLELLNSGHLAGAALDVFRQEPLPADHPFWSHPKIRITPHAAAVTPLGPAAHQIAAKIRRFDRAEPITGIVDRGRGY